MFIVVKRESYFFVNEVMENPTTAVQWVQLMATIVRKILNFHIAAGEDSSVLVLL